MSVIFLFHGEMGKTQDSQHGEMMLRTILPGHSAREVLEL